MVEITAGLKGTHNIKFIYFKGTHYASSQWLMSHQGT